MRWKGFKTIAIGLGLISLAQSVLSREAMAYPFYVESTVGGTHFRSTDTLFSSGVTSASDLGYNFNLGVFWSPIKRFSAFELHLGLVQQFLNANQGANAYSVIAPTGVVRLQFLSGYVSGGVAPVLWNRAGTSMGFDNYNIARSSIGIMGESGLLYNPTPKFSMGASLGLMWFYMNSTLTASPSSTISFVMRFYFGSVESGDSSGSSSGRPLEYDGWRYLGSDPKF